MSTLVFPPSLTPAKIDWHLDRGGVMNRGLLSASMQRVDFGFQSWRASVGMPTLVEEDAAIFQAFMNEACRFDNHFYFSFPQSLRGSFDASEVLTNGDFTNGTTGWSLANSASHKVGSRLARVENGAATAAYIYQTKTLTLNVPYVVVAYFYIGSAADNRVVVLRSSDLVNYISNTDVPYGAYVATFTPTTSADTRIGLGVGTTTLGNYTFTPYVSASRCLLVNGASQTGSTLTIDGGAVSTNSLLKIGDMFTVMVDSVPSLHRLTRDLDTNSSGQGIVRFEPALPGSPADNAPLILNNPFCRMLIPEHSTSAMFTPPMLMGSAFECVEDPTR